MAYETVTRTGAAGKSVKGNKERVVKIQTCEMKPVRYDPGDGKKEMNLAGLWCIFLSLCLECISSVGGDGSSMETESFVEVCVKVFRYKKRN